MNLLDQTPPAIQGTPRRIVTHAAPEEMLTPEERRQQAILGQLERMRGKTMREVADALSMTISTAWRTFLNLECAGKIKVANRCTHGKKYVRTE